MKYLKELLLPIIVTIATPIATALSSEIIKGDWLNFFKNIHSVFYSFFIAFILVWITLILIRNRIKRNKEYNMKSNSCSESITIYGYRNISEIILYKVKWKINVPNLGHFENYEYSPEDIVIDTPPRCPTCGTKLEEQKRIWRGYSWSCVLCDFKVINRDNFNAVKNKVKKIAERQLEMGCIEEE
jgi:hypothetical protein